MALPAELQRYDALVNVLVDAIVREIEAGEPMNLPDPDKEKAGHVRSVTPAFRTTHECSRKRRR